jgi:solute:Na+ symporter, SSS family
MKVNAVAAAVTVILFAIVTGAGFFAGRWRRPKDMGSLDEWGLGGRSFGGVVSWFLLGGDLYTAYTFVALPGAMYAAGAVSGWFTVAFAALIWPIVFVVMPRLWSVAHRHGMVTVADFVSARFGSRALSVAVAFTGILALMPYIALQLVGIQAVLQVMGVGAGSSGLVKDLPLFIAFGVLAAYTYTSGLRAPALIAFFKDTLIYVTVLVAVIYIPLRLGGFGHIFSAVQAHATATEAAAKAAHVPNAFAMLPGPKSYWAYGTLALGSAMALFMYPHAVTGVMATKSRETIRRNTIALPLYSVVLAFVALLGYMAIAAGIRTSDSRLAAPLLFRDMFPSWFAGVAYATVIIAALVPAAIMSISAANLFTRNIYRELVRPRATPAQEARVSKTVSLVVKLGALAFLLGINTQYAINLYLLGGIWVLQTFPSVAIGLFTRWFHRRALLAGWLVGMAYGTYEAYNVSSPTVHHFAGSTAKIPFIGQTGYIALTAFVINLAVAVVVTIVLRLAHTAGGPDLTAPEDYLVDGTDEEAGAPILEPVSAARGMEPAEAR